MQETQETRVQSLDWEDSLEEEMATQSSILAWKIPWTEESGGLWSMELQRVRHDWATNHTHTQTQTHTQTHASVCASQCWDWRCFPKINRKTLVKLGGRGSGISTRTTEFQQDAGSKAEFPWFTLVGRRCHAYLWCTWEERTSCCLLGELVSSSIFLTRQWLRLGSASALAPVDDSSSGHPWSLALRFQAQTWLASLQERSGKFHHLPAEISISSHGLISCRSYRETRVPEEKLQKWESQGAGASPSHWCLWCSAASELPETPPSQDFLRKNVQRVCWYDAPCFLYLFIYLLATPPGMRDLTSLTRDWTTVPSSGSVESYSGRSQLFTFNLTWSHPCFSETCCFAKAKAPQKSLSSLLSIEWAEKAAKISFQILRNLNLYQLHTQWDLAFTQPLCWDPSDKLYFIKFH